MTKESLNFLYHAPGSVELDKDGDCLDLCATIALEAEDRLIAGYGACRSCSCPGFNPKTNLWCHCSHHYSQHWA